MGISEEEKKTDEVSEDNFDTEIIDFDSSPEEDPDYVRSPREKTPAVKPEKTDIKREVLSYAIYIGVAILITFLILTFVGQRMVVQGSSMEHTLSDGESVIVDKLSYRFSDPKRYDIIVFPYEHAKDTNYIKRIIGLPGERVRIDEEGKIYVNGEVLQEDYGLEIIKKPGRAAEEILLGYDEYFVLGDNRNNSMDSRDPLVGNIKRDRIIGKAFLRCWPFDKFGFIKHQ